MKKYSLEEVMVMFLFFVIACISIVVVNNNDCKNYNETEFQFIVTDSVMTVYNNDFYVGTVKVQGELDSLLVDYNE
jgi:hypothetical protein